MIGDTSKDADIAAFPTQQWRRCVGWGLYRQWQVGCMRCRRQRKHEQCHQVELFHGVARPLFESWDGLPFSLTASRPLIV